MSDKPPMRGVVALGLCALLALAAHQADAKTGDEQANAKQAIATSLNHISARYDEQAERAKRADEEEQPCGPKQYRSNSDLCAQWKAADAAADSAWWAWAGGLIGILSFFGVVGAIVAALHSNVIAREIARRELRPYAYPKAVAWQTMDPKSETTGRIDFRVQWENSGHTPAYDLAIWTDGVLLAKDEPPSDLSDKARSCPLPLAPRVTSNSPVVSVSSADIEDAYNGKRFIFLIGRGEYTDNFTSKKRTVKYCWRISLLRDPEKANSWAATNWATWTIVGKHNGYEGEEK